MVYLTVLAGLELAVIVCLIAAFLVERKHLAELLAHFEVMHQQERARFLGAVQRPDMVQPSVPARPPSKDEVEKRQRLLRDLASVGTVTHNQEKP